MADETGSYATVDEYRAVTLDQASTDAQVRFWLDSQSAELREACGLPDGARLSGDALVSARKLVIDAARKALVPATMEGIGDVTGANQASFSANGFSQSVSFSNPSGSAYFDRAALRRLRRKLGVSQRIGTISPWGVS